MGSGWRWELRLPACAPTEAVLRDVVALAVDHGLSPRNTLGTITVIDDDGGHAFWPDQDQTITEIANGAYNTILWSGEVDGFLSYRSEAERAGARRGRAHGRRAPPTGLAQRWAVTPISGVTAHLSCVLGKASANRALLRLGR